MRKILVNKNLTDDFKFLFWENDIEIWIDKIFCKTCSRRCSYEYSRMKGHRVWCGLCGKKLPPEKIKRANELLKIGKVLNKYEL